MSATSELHAWNVVGHGNALLLDYRRVELRVQWVISDSERSREELLQQTPSNHNSLSVRLLCDTLMLNPPSPSLRLYKHSIVSRQAITETLYCCLLSNKATYLVLKQ